jgi:hypothetical protein
LLLDRRPRKGGRSFILFLENFTVFQGLVAIVRLFIDRLRGNVAFTLSVKIQIFGRVSRFHPKLWVVAGIVKLLYRVLITTNTWEGISSIFWRFRLVHMSPVFNLQDL